MVDRVVDLSRELRGRRPAIQDIFGVDRYPWSIVALARQSSTYVIWKDFEGLKKD